MSSRKADLGDIDEDFLLDSIKKIGKDETPTIPPSVTDETAIDKPKESVKRKRNAQADYGSTFLQRNEIKTRKCVYISREIHNKISKIVNIVADKEISVGGYVDTVLAQHLETNRDEINELYRKGREEDELV